jgi:L-threonylcarbamoyladenylate synthase
VTTPVTVADVDKAVAALRDGGVIGLPTDTLYALTAVASDESAVRRVFQIKGREPDKPLPLFVSGLTMAERIAVFNDLARLLAERFWPGALTIVLPKQPAFDSLALAGESTVALRVPDHPIALAVIEAAGQPVTATSANLSGGPDPITADEVRRQLGDTVDFVLDAGPCAVAVASTIVDCSRAEPVIIRAGAIDEVAITAALRE